jgi:hypothetical protein
MQTSRAYAMILARSSGEYSSRPFPGYLAFACTFFLAPVFGIASL